MEYILNGLSGIVIEEHCNQVNILGENHAISKENIDLSPFIMSDINLKESYTDELAKMSESITVQFDADDNSYEHINHNESGTSNYRSMRTRSSKDDFLHKMNRRTIQKPFKRNGNRTNDFKPALSQALIKKIYLNKKLTNFRPTSLETIFEEEDENDDMKTTNQVRMIGSRKLRRLLSCTDGINQNKHLIKQRRAKIKKVFGRRFALKKIPLNDFVDRLKKGMEESESEENEQHDDPVANITTATTSNNDSGIESEDKNDDINILENDGFKM